MKRILGTFCVAVALAVCTQAAFAQAPAPAAATAPAAPVPPPPKGDKVGAMVPAWSAEIVGETKTITSEELKGKNYAIIFVNASCSACRGELTELSGRKFGDKLTIMMGSMDFNPEKVVLVYRDAYKVPYPILNDSKQTISTVFGFESSPCSVIVGPDGKVLERFVGFSAASREKVLAAFDKYSK